MMARGTADMNGNWAPIGSRMFFVGRSGRASGPSTAAYEEMMREGGVGTAGIGWSPDGTRL